MSERERGEAVPSWQLDELIGEVNLYRETWSLRIKAHLSDGPYGRSAAGGLVPLRAQHGRCTSVDAKAYMLVPAITLDVTLAPTLEGSIGTVDASDWQGMKPEYVGEAAAFYYHEDRVLCVWECYFEEQYQQGEPAEDPNYPILWHGVEAALLRQFPDARQLVTTATDPLYELSEYERFLAQIGYARLNPQAFGKPC